MTPRRDHCSVQQAPHRLSGVAISSAAKLQNYKSRYELYHRQEEELASILVPYLALRAYHLPKNGWWADWVQYQCNNHPIFGICCHHRLHPIGVRMRLVALIGSALFGLTITNLLYLYFLVDDQQHYDETLFSLTLSANVTDSVVTSDDQVVVTRGMLVLWTVGGGLHALYDNLIWYLIACACCQPGGSLSCCGCCRMLGSYVAVFIVIVMAAIASFVFLLRESVDEDTQVHDFADLTDPDNVEFQSDRQFESVEYIVWYLVELGLALLIYYPIVATVLFSGILGCCRLPILGGRPVEVRMEQKAAEKEKAKQKRKQSRQNQV